MKLAPSVIVGIVGWVVLSFSGDLAAQQPAAAARNLIGNGGFETSFRRENLWDGVDTTGYLSGERGALPILTGSGTIADSSMPLSVSVADMNADGLPDIVTMDVVGYLRIFFNTGTPTEPKFAVGDLAGIFLSRISADDKSLVGADATNKNLRLGARIHVTDMFKTGKKDIILGNYMGEIMQLLNAGTIQKPEFRQPGSISQIILPTSKNPAHLWGNLFSPTTWDWNRDGKEDLLLGEGSYSANNIHALMNSGGGKPVFDEASRHVLAFGDGLEQLTPTVVDYNGDGMPDLLVSERTGKIAVYLNKGGEWKSGTPPPEVPFASFITTSTGAPLSFGGICTVSAADLNGDGLFDLVVGKSNGRVAVAYNKGTKQEPKFAPPVDLKGDAGTPPMGMPSGWEVDYGLRRGNFLAYVTVVKVTDDEKLDPAEGKAALKIGYAPSHNRIVPPPTSYLPALANNFNPDQISSTTQTIEDALQNAPARFFGLRQSGRARMKTGKTYIFSMKVRGNARDGALMVSYLGVKKLGEDKVTLGGRESAARQRNEAREEKTERARFSPGVKWTEVSKEIRVAFTDKDLASLTETSSVTVQVTFSLPPGGELYIDDVKLVEK